jgi:sulfur carrier protein
MKVIINDTPIELNISTLESALADSGINDMRGLAVAINDTIIPRKTWDTYILKENDTITIIRATQGG